MTAAIQLIVGLGNPGKEYEQTRHNAGAWFVESLAKSKNTSLKFDQKFHGLVSKTSIGDHECYLLIPTTFMNLSGRSVLALAHFYKIPPEAILVVHDDLDLPTGVVRIKSGGGHGGHNGLRDIITQLGSRDFARLRIGISHPGNKDKVTGHVLSPAQKDEKILIEHSIEKAFTVLPDIISGNLSNAMQTLHTDERKNDGI